MTPSHASDLIGLSVDGYQVVSRLGGGGMGVVYEARARDGRRVAIKTLKPAFANDRELVGRFLGEARALKAVSHRALVEILSIGQLDDGTHYMVMEFLEGRSFADVIEHGAPLDVREVLTWMVEVLDALETVHAAGVIHRDLKPSNLFLARTGIGPQVKLIDFGIAKHTGLSGRDAPKTLVSAIVGTPDYMSPEQVNGLEVTAASDLYALGCVMFEMLTGETPFDEESSVRKMLMHVEQPAPRVASRVSVPDEVDELIAWTMQKDPAQRPTTARELKERIEQVMGDALGGGTGPMATRQVKSLPARDEKTMLASVNELQGRPTVTEPSMPVVPNGRPSPGRAQTVERPAVAGPERTVIGPAPSPPDRRRESAATVDAERTMLGLTADSEATSARPEPTVIGPSWPASPLLEAPTFVVDPLEHATDAAAAEPLSELPVRLRRRGEPGRSRPGQVTLPVWALAAGGVALLLLALLLIWRLVHTPAVSASAPTVEPPGPAAPKGPTPPQAQPSQPAEPQVAAPPAPAPKRKKPPPPLVRKHNRTRRR